MALVVKVRAEGLFATGAKSGGVGPAMMGAVAVCGEVMMVGNGCLEEDERFCGVDAMFVVLWCVVGVERKLRGVFKSDRARARL